MLQLRRCKYIKIQYIVLKLYFPHLVEKYFVDSHHSSVMQVQKNKRNVKSRKKQKLNLISKNEEENSAIPGENSCSYCSEDDSNAFHELNGGVTSSSDSKGVVVVNTSGKTRANRGSATDPQSLYARVSTFSVTQ